jgi:hypothetical protein
MTAMATYIAHEHPMLEEDDIMLRAYAENAPGSFAQGFSSTDGFCDLVNVTSPLLSKKVLGTSSD